MENERLIKQTYNDLENQKDRTSKSFRTSGSPSKSPTFGQKLGKIKVERAALAAENETRNGGVKSLQHEIEQRRFSHQRM